MKHIKQRGQLLLLCLINATFGWPSLFLHATTQEKTQSICVTATVSVGELIDKITILEIKAEQIHDKEKLRNVHIELTELQQTFNTSIIQTKELNKLTKELRTVNMKLWDIEDAIREKERKKEFDDEFITLARSVYITNDERCRIKREINILIGSHVIEEKSYSDYQNG